MPPSAKKWLRPRYFIGFTALFHLILLAGFLLSGGCDRLWDYFAPASIPEERSVQNGDVKHLDGRPLVTLYGDTPAMGRAHGRLLAASIRKQVDAFRDAPAKSDGNAAVVENFEKGFPPGIREELQALAKASGVSYADLLRFNLGTESGPPAPSAAFAVDERRTTDRNPILGWKRSFADFGNRPGPMLFHMRRIGKIAYMALSPPGFVGVLAGMNAHGLAIAITPGRLEKRLDGGTPLPLIVREMLENAKTIEAAMHMLGERQAPRTASVTFMDRRGRTAVAEVSPFMTRFRYVDRQTLAVTDRFVTRGFEDPDPAQGRGADALEKAVASKRLFDAEALQKLLDTVPPKHRAVRSLVFEPATLRLHMSESPDEPYCLVDAGERFRAFGRSR